LKGDVANVEFADIYFHFRILKNYLEAGGLRKNCFPSSTKPIPPNINIEEIKNLSEIGSEMKIKPPKAAINGTDSCDTAARVADKFRKAIYLVCNPFQKQMLQTISLKKFHFRLGAFPQKIQYLK